MTGEYFVSSRNDLVRQADQYGVPVEDAALIALNASGINAGTHSHARGRIKVTPIGKSRSYFTALTVTDKPLAPFTLADNVISLADEPLFTTSELMPDTCTDTYWRDGYKGLTINTNSRANCRGCAFCGTYSLDNDESPPLLTKNALEQKAEELKAECPKGDLSELERIGVVTGCFANEEALAEHLGMLREAFQQYGFNGSIIYVGSQLRTPETVRELVKQGDFGLFVTLEAFTRRTLLMKNLKSSLTLEGSREVMAAAKEAGAETNFLYIAGLDPLSAMEEEFPKFENVLTRAPQVQIFQVYTPHQIALRDPNAAKLDYFLRASRIVEQALPDLPPPTPANNFRSLWYTAYRGVALPDTSNTIEN